MIVIIPPSMTLDLIRQHQAELRAAAERHRTLHPRPSRVDGYRRTPRRERSTMQRLVSALACGSSTTTLTTAGGPE